MKSYVSTKWIGQYKVVCCYRGELYYELQLGPLVFQIGRRTVEPFVENIPRKRLSIWHDKCWRN